MAKLETMTGTGKAIVNTPARAQRAPTNMPTAKKKTKNKQQNKNKQTNPILSSIPVVAFVSNGHRG